MIISINELHNSDGNTSSVGTPGSDKDILHDHVMVFQLRNCTFALT